MIPVLSDKCHIPEIRSIDGQDLSPPVVEFFPRDSLSRILALEEPSALRPVEKSSDKCYELEPGSRGAMQRKASDDMLGSHFVGAKAPNEALDMVSVAAVITRPRDLLMPHGVCKAQKNR